MPQSNVLLSVSVILNFCTVQISSFFWMVLSFFNLYIFNIKFSYALFKLSMSQKMCLFFYQGRFYVNYLLLWALDLDQNKVFYIKTYFVGLCNLLLWALDLDQNKVFYIKTYFVGLCRWFCLMLHGYHCTKYLNLM